MVLRETDTGARNLGLLSLVEGAVGRHSGTLGEGTEGAFPGLAASPVESCRSQPGKEDRGHSRESPHLTPLVFQSSGGPSKSPGQTACGDPGPEEL